MMKRRIRAQALLLGTRLTIAAALVLMLLAGTVQASAAAPRSVIIKGFPSVQQWYSLSCEYAAAAAVSLYWGRLVSQSDFLREVPQSPNPHLGFRGDINAEWGGIRNYGIYAEPLVPVLEARGYLVDVFYGGTARLQQELAAGHPVVVWMTGKHAAQPVTTATYQGASFKLVPYEHATVAYGYDAGGVWIMDVGNGQRYYYSWSHFISRWNYFDEMALVMTPGWN
jgi:uncharacterized protein YvpB